MELFGFPLQTIYLVMLIVFGVLTLLYLLFADILEGIATTSFDFFNPTLCLAFFTFFSAGGYILERLSPFKSIFIVLISIITSLFLVTLLNVFILIPLSKAEESLVYTQDSLKGRIGKVIIPIPEDGFGEVLLESNSGRISKPAACFEGSAINEGQIVLVIDIQHGVLYVSPHEFSEEFYS
ncbi:NfeD family protein [Peribacillus alkalitolerans]|uniref:NfeD family protein n=1 Tax=Peribacillus alkalitolerans TaxID=1550385 RepID=UPI0013D78E42|nr:NfeD family protein [Peribacillus alkalitolerans]